ncbi:MAG: SPOR domain-containing protein [Methylophilaceae bacterium]
MQKDQIDQGLNFKKRARRRLVGAIALVLLMIILLPMVLEDREKASPEEVTIVMPSQQESDLSASTVLDPGMKSSQESVVQKEDVEVDSSVSEVVELELPKAESKPGPEAKEVVVQKEEAVKPKSVEPKKEPVKLATKSKEPLLPVSNKFYVQIGVFSDPSNVKKLQVKLEELGYKSLTEKMTTDTGEKTRLRTEIFDGRNEAAIALENIKDQGLTGMVVNQK